MGHGAIKVYYRGRRMAFTELQEEIPKASRPVPPAARVIVVTRVDTKRSQSVRNLIAWNGQFPISGLPLALIGNASRQTFARRGISIRGVFDEEVRRKPLAFVADAWSYGI